MGQARKLQSTLPGNSAFFRGLGTLPEAALRKARKAQKTKFHYGLLANPVDKRKDDIGVGAQLRLRGHTQILNPTAHSPSLL